MSEARYPSLIWCLSGQKCIFSRKRTVQCLRIVVLPNFTQTAPFSSVHFKEGFLFTADAYRSPDESSPLFAMDCEMVETENGKLEVARIALVNEELQVLMDDFMKPHKKIQNYLTQ